MHLFLTKWLWYLFQKLQCDGPSLIFCYVIRIHTACKPPIPTQHFAFVDSHSFALLSLALCPPLSLSLTVLGACRKATHRDGLEEAGKRATHGDCLEAATMLTTKMSMMMTLSTICVRVCAHAYVSRYPSFCPVGITHVCVGWGDNYKAATANNGSMPRTVTTTIATNNQQPMTSNNSNIHIASNNNGNGMACDSCDFTISGPLSPIIMLQGLT
jgi:hypothetical protein